MSLKEIESNFHSAILDLHDRTKKEFGYNASRFLRMVTEKGGVKTVTDLVMPDNPSEGYSFLREKGRLDLAVEVYLIKPEYQDLFSPEVCERVEKRLREYVHKFINPEKNRAVIDAYRQSPGEGHIWEGFDPDDIEHGFHETKQGLRFTASKRARRELLGRLLKLNHKRFAEEVALGLHDKKKGKGKKRKAAKKTNKPAAKKADTNDMFGEVE